MTVKPITDASFRDDVLEASGPVLVDFWAQWCGSCRSLAPALEDMSEELGDKVSVTTLDIDDNPDVPTRYGVRSIPAMILFSNGEPVAVRFGAAPKSVLRNWLQDQLANPDPAASDQAGAPGLE